MAISALMDRHNQTGVSKSQVSAEFVEQGTAGGWSRIA